MTGENTDCNCGKVKTAPIYQMEAYQKTPPKVKHTDITQKSPNWSQQLENIKSLQKKPQQNLKKIVLHHSTIRASPAVLKNGSPNLPD